MIYISTLEDNNSSNNDNTYVLLRQKLRTRFLMGPFEMFNLLFKQHRIILAINTPTSAFYKLNPHWPSW